MTCSTTQNCLSQNVVSKYGFDSLVRTQTKKYNDLKDVNIVFKASMTCLHRQVFAMTSYACNQLGQAMVADCHSEQLLSALLYYFDNNDEGARKLLPLVAEYVARSFHLIKASDGWLRLPPNLLAKILCMDCLSSNLEVDVLRFVARYSMTVEAKGSEPNPFASLALHVRFPFITQEQLATVPSADERSFLVRQPCYASLIQEAVRVQQRKRPSPDAGAAEVGRASKRARYNAIPDLDVDYMVQLTCSAMAAGQ